MNPPDQLIADARNHLDLLNDAARKREGARIIERLLARVRELESTLAERWPNLAHQDRDRLLALCGGRADVWLSTAACETIERLSARIRELEAERAEALAAPGVAVGERRRQEHQRNLSGV